MKIKVKMEDDKIDIEEHNLLDNPTVRRIFPNISILKVEVIDFNDEAEKPVNDSEQAKCKKHPKFIQERNVTPYLPKHLNQELNTKFSESISAQTKDGCQSDYYTYNNERNKRISTGADLDKDIEMKKMKKVVVNTFTETSLLNSANYNILIRNPRNNNVTSKPLEISKMLTTSNVLTEQEGIHSEKQIISTLQHSKQKEQSTRVPSSGISTIKSKSHSTNKLTLKQSKIPNQEQGNKIFVQQSFKACNKIILGTKNSDLKLQHKILVKQSKLKILKVKVENLATFLCKSNRFCKICLTLFPSNKSLTDHNNVSHFQLNANLNTINASFHKKINLEYKCNLCGRVFSSKGNLNRHKKNIHSLDIKTKISKKMLNVFNTQLCGNQNEEQNNFKCVHCDNSFKSHQAIIDHMYSVLQLKDVTKFTECVNLDIKNVNKNSPDLEINYRTDEKMLNDVVKSQSYKNESHFNRSYIKNCLNENIYLLKSAIFKCVKCHICCLSAEEAANHMKHGDASLKQKCLKCSHMFMKEELSLHAQQHLFCDNFEVFEIGENAFLHVLYKCLNCTAYFREKDFYNHYSVCEIQLPDAAYCKTCHILIDNKIKELHEYHHEQAEGKKLNIILVESDVITNNGGSVDNKKQMPVIYQKEFREKKTDALVEMDVVQCNEESDTNIRQTCYVEQIKTKTDFFSPVLKNKAMTLRFLYCGTCKSFIYVTKVRKLYNHLKAHCLRDINCVCKYCGLVLSEKTINNHRKLHQAVPDLTINDFKFHELQSGKRICPPIPKYPNCNICGIHFITKSAIISHECNEEYLTCPLCKIKLTSAAFPLHLSFHNYVSKEESSIPLPDIPVHPKEPSTQLTNLLDSNKCREDVLLLVYMCKICKVTVDSYDAVIEHCHEHIISQEKEKITKPCVTCNLIFDITCYDNHEMLHSCNQNMKFSILTYDAFYVTAKDNIWLNHLFGSLPKKVINRIIGNSIYKSERKIRLQIHKDGLEDLTHYMCAKCKNVIDSSALFEHCLMGTLCCKLKAIPCNFCGISLISNEFRMQHEKIHEKRNVTLKSYRIIHFNSVIDSKFNQMLCLPRQYVLYECRNCNGVVDKKRYQYHTCDFEDLSKCPHCGLLLYSNDYMAHVLKHNEFCSFRANNIKVILLGLKQKGAKINDRVKPSFEGVTLDYLVYQCKKCQVCLKDKQSTLTHDCIKNSAVTKCHICELYFEDSQYKNHSKLHEHDSQQFSKENMAVVQFGSNLKSSDVDIILIDDEDNLQVNGKAIENSQINNSNKLIDNISSTEITVTKYDIIFKCLCGLHFLNEESALAHYTATKCNNPRTSKQTCSKCRLCFKPSVLYSHLLKHHGHKNIFYNFNIIEIPNSTTLASERHN